MFATAAAASSRALATRASASARSLWRGVTARGPAPTPGGAPAGQEARPAACPPPPGGGRGKPPLGPRVVACGLDPGAEPVPLPQQRLVGDLDRGLARFGGPVQREQAMAGG